MKNVAVILAGGVGLRMGYDLPKQFVKVAGKMVIEHTLDAFQNHPEIDEIAVVTNPDYLFILEAVAAKGEHSKLKKILHGGKERYHSSLSAIHAYDDDTNLIFHDAVRPLVNRRIISDCVAALERHCAVDVAIRTTDTIISVTQDDAIDSIPDRKMLRNGQTPQAFRLPVIRRAYELALQDPDFRTTDDCGVVRRYLPQERIHVVDGELFNMKLTYREDLFLIEKLFQLRASEVRCDSVTAEASVAMNGKRIVVFGGSCGIGKEIVEHARANGAKVYPFSRSLNGVDVSNREQVAQALKKVHEVEHRIDYVVNTAGILRKEPLAQMSDEDIVSLIGVNYLGAVTVAKEAFPYLKESRGGLLLFTSSSYTRGRSMYSLYSSSKAAIVNLAQALGEEWFDFGIHVNCLNPERTKTPMRTRNFGLEPEDSLLKPETVAIASINALASSMTGEVIDVKIAAI